MNEKKDNKLEDVFFEIVLNNTQLTLEIIKLYELIQEQSISESDKEIITKKIFGFSVVNNDEEIIPLLKTIRWKQDSKNQLLYTLILSVSERLFNIEDSVHSSFLQSNTKEDISTDLIYLFQSTTTEIYEHLNLLLENKKSLLESFSDDYLDDDELQILESEIEWLFEEVLQKIFETETYIKISNKIEKELLEKKKISEI